MIDPNMIEDYKRRAGIPTQGESSPDTRTPNPVSQQIPQSEVSTQGIPSTPKQEFQPTTQDDLIILTLTEQLGRNNKLEKEKMKMSTEPTTPQTPPQGDALAPNPSSPMQQQGNYPF